MLVPTDKHNIFTNEHKLFICNQEGTKAAGFTKAKTFKKDDVFTKLGIDKVF